MRFPTQICLLSAGILMAAAPNSPAQNPDDLTPPAGATTEPAVDKPRFDPTKVPVEKMMVPNAQDKFLGIQLFLGDKKVAWEEIYDELAIEVKDTSESDVVDSLAIGARVVDGVLALHSKNSDALNASAEDIQALAVRLGATEEELARAETASDLAKDKEWSLIFTELTRLQADLVKALDAQERKNIRPLVIAGGWVQATRYMSKIILSNYSPEASNFLREPGIVKQLQSELAALPADVKSETAVQAIIDSLTEVHAIVNIPTDGSIAMEKVERLFEISNALASKI